MNSDTVGIIEWLQVMNIHRMYDLGMESLHISPSVLVIGIPLVALIFAVISIIEAWPAKSRPTHRVLGSKTSGSGNLRYLVTSQWLKVCKGSTYFEIVNADKCQPGDKKCRLCATAPIPRDLCPPVRIR